jgi:hypothetical protein
LREDDRNAFQYKSSAYVCNTIGGTRPNSRASIRTECYVSVGTNEYMNIYIYIYIYIYLLYIYICKGIGMSLHLR